MNRIIIFCLVIGCLLQDLAFAQAESASARQPISGVWVWRRETVQTPEAQDQLIAFCKDHGFNRLLMQIHYKPKSEGSDRRELALPDQLRRLLSEGAKNGINVEALDGAKDMALKENWTATLAQLDAILAFNRTQPEGERFVGMHYDIEPYIMPEWKTDQRPAIMLEYLQLLEQAKQKLDAETPRLLMAVDIPMWYDRKTDPADNAILEFNGETKNLHQHLQDLCDYIGIMSYRRMALGQNGVIAHVTAELEYAEKIGKFICPALETIELKTDKQITFFGLPAEKFWETKKTVEQTLKDRPGFGGMLIHSYDGVKALVNQRTPQPAAME